MSLIYKSQTISDVGGSSGGVTMDQVNTAIQDAVADIQPQEVYSTEETRIGTWIDGKPLYRKVAHLSLLNSTSNQIFDIGLADVDTVAGVKTVSKRSAIDSGWVQTGYTVSNVFYFICGLRTDNFKLWVSTKGMVDFAGQPAFAIVEYTKTTDQGGDRTSLVYKGQIITHVMTCLDNDMMTFKWWSPEMTGNNTPAPYVASSSSVFNVNVVAYHAFNTSTSEFWIGNGSNEWIQFDFGAATEVYGIKLRPHAVRDDYTHEFPKSVTISGSNDGSSFDTLYTSDGIDYNPETYAYRTCMFNSVAQYRYYRIQGNGNYAGTSYNTIESIMFYRPE